MKTIALVLATALTGAALIALGAAEVWALTHFAGAPTPVATFLVILINAIILIPTAASAGLD